MKGVFTCLLLGTLFFSCTKEQLTVAETHCMQESPTWCATVRCNPDSKPVCGCNNITYASACEAQCAGVTSYTMGACK